MDTLSQVQSLESTDPDLFTIDDTRSGRPVAVDANVKHEASARGER
jgi:hypothetical protein